MDRKKAIEILRKNRLSGEAAEALGTLVPELKETRDERIIRELTTYLSNELHNVKQPTPRTNEFEEWLSWIRTRDAYSTIKEKDKIDEGFTKFVLTETEKSSNQNWKPTKEQMEQFEEIVRIYDCPPGVVDLCNELKKLYNGRNK